MSIAKTIILEILPKKALKMASQLVIFRLFFFRLPDPKSEKNDSRKSTNKKILALPLL